MHENLKAFVSTVDKGSFSGAAKELYLSPVAIMKRVNQLEAWAGTPLLVRTSKGASPTEAGKVIYEGARKIIEQTEAMLHRAREAAGMGSAATAVRISAPYAGSLKILSDLWGAVEEQGAHFAIQIVPIGIKYDSANKVYGLLDSVIDFVIGPFNQKRYPKLRGLELARLPLCIAVQKGHPLACRQSVRIEELDVPAVAMAQRGHVPEIDVVRESIERRRPDIAIVDDANDYSMDAYNHYCREGGGMIAPGGYSELQPSIATVPFEPHMELPIYLVGTEQAWTALGEFVELLRGVLDSGQDTGNE